MPGGVVGRRLEFTYALAPFSLGVVQWISVAGGVATTLTGTFSIDRVNHRQLLDGIVARALVPGELDPSVPGPTSTAPLPASTRTSSRSVNPSRTCPPSVPPTVPQRRADVPRGTSTSSCGPPDVGCARSQRRLGSSPPS